MGATASENSEHTISLDLREQDQESLLVSFLSELLYLAEKQMMAREFHLKINGLRLTGSLVMVSILNMQTEIKAVTYNNLRIHQYDEKYQTQLVFDI
jgi:SHS2 domain-containing protein